MGNKHNKHKRESEDDKIKKLLIQKFQFPYAIKSDGGITYCFNNISADDIIVHSRREYFFEKVQSEENNSNMGILEVANDLQLNYVINDSKFKLQVNNLKAEAKKSLLRQIFVFLKISFFQLILAKNQMFLAIYMVK